jgi:hypothetical protein
MPEDNLGEAISSEVNKSQIKLEAGEIKAEIKWEVDEIKAEILDEEEEEDEMISVLGGVQIFLKEETDTAEEPPGVGGDALTPTIRLVRIFLYYQKYVVPVGSVPPLLLPYCTLVTRYQYGTLGR